MQTEYILKAMDAALAAGKEILNVYNDPSSDFQVERKADNSPLTLAAVSYTHLTLPTNREV